MTKTEKRKRLPDPFRNKPETSELIGQFFDGEAEKESGEKGAGYYRRVAYDRMAAAGEYRQAKDFSGNFRKSSGYERLEARAIKQAQEAEKMAELYESTQHYHPLWRGIIRWIKGSHIWGFFLFSILLSDPRVTGNLIGNSGSINSYLGIALFFFGIAACYLVFWKNHLMNRAKDKY